MFRIICPNVSSPTSKLVLELSETTAFWLTDILLNQQFVECLYLYLFCFAFRRLSALCLVGKCNGSLLQPLVFLVGHPVFVDLRH